MNDIVEHDSGTAGDGSPPLPVARPIAVFFVEAYLDRLIDFARQTGLIAGAKKSHADASVTIHLSSVSVSMFYEDAVDYLADSIREELQPGIDAIQQLR